MKTIHLHKQTGSSLVVVMSVLATLMVVVAVAADYTWTVKRHVQRSNTLQSAVAVGDSCIELLFSHWRQTCSTAATTLRKSNDFTVPSKIPLPTTSELNLPSSANFAKTDASGSWYDPAHDDYAPDYTISNYKVVAVDAEWKALASASTAPEPILGQIAATQSSAGPNTTLVYNYIASADVTLPALGPTGKVVAKVRRVFQKQQMSPWNFAIFYVDPLEIHPGPDFTVTGWVHTNSDLYTGHDSLTFADKVTYGSDWFVNFMTPAANPRTWVDSAGVTRYAVPAPGDTTHPETPASPHWPGYPPVAGVQPVPPARDQALQPFGLDATSLFNITDANPNNDSYRELIEPPTATPDPLSSQRYWDQSDVIIQVDNSNNVTIGIPHINATTGVADGVITPFTSLLASPSSGGLSWGSALRAKYQALYDMFNGPSGPNATNAPITTNQPFTDTRESPTANNMRLVTLDVSKLQNGTGGLNPTFKANDVSQANGVSDYFKGIVYVYDNSATTHILNSDGSVNQNPTSPVRKGVRLKNGSKIAASTGLTVVSPNPVYIWGDFNTGRSYNGSASPPSNNTTSDPTTPQVVGYNNPSNPSGPGVRAPCSILSDAVTILSNSWDDANAGTKPDASNTTINAAIISGIVPSNAYGDGAYSGGAENFPRFLEDWTNKTLTYYGSMVELYKSQQSIAKWTCCVVYDPPVRQWYFDPNFRTKPPPGSIMLYSYIKGKWSVL